MKVQVVGCSHHETSISLRERLAFTPDQTKAALDAWQVAFPDVEMVLVSTCNRTEVYTASGDRLALPPKSEVAAFLAKFHGLDSDKVAAALYEHVDEGAANHAFTVASSLDSMVLGEPQILSQVKQAYQTASDQDATGPLTHALFQAAIRVARRITSETTIHQRRVSIPSVAVADFAQQIFESFDDKHTVVIGAGEMAEETLRYLQDEGAHQITVVNRNFDRAEDLAKRFQGQAVPWDTLDVALATADLVVSTTGATEPIVTLDRFERIERTRYRGPLFVLDLAVPRDFDPAIGERPDVYLYSVDDLQATCQQNRKLRNRELPKATQIVEQEAARFMTALRHHATGPVIRQLRHRWEKPKAAELKRLLNKLPELDDRAKEEIQQSFDRLTNKLMHPLLESLRDESRHSIPHALLESLSRLFRLKD